ncbi:Peptidase propeptide and YPEB domain-containing protein [Pseudobutyrivibrio sp. YE44]|uniref:PepSY domain-containing protein n=1 Tax=Pseudobutyrivibrio sp. YE44 TaxID=1520802 RepID=UPI000887FC4C|nr:PepSY domain-containing protein [Pseudobutyrivibrio sp. YE44]SDB13508.1 Peptidase propeptide and YPEB domain-containing protein [Pseudobutyrivibrio sp. YE44]
MMKKVLASVLTLAMALSVFTFGASTLAYAAEDTQVEAAAITESDALQIALGAAGYSEAAVKYPKVMDGQEEDGTAIYKVVFYLGFVEFGYHIDKANGTILKTEIND